MDEVKELKTRLKDAEGNASHSTDMRVQQLEEELSALQETLEKEKTNREKLEADYKDVKKQHAGCSQKANIQVTLLQDQITKLEEEIDYQKKNVQIEIFNKEQVEEELDTVKKEMGRMQAELKAIQNAATKKTHEATALQRNVSSATEEKQMLKNRVRALASNDVSSHAPYAMYLTIAPLPRWSSSRASWSRRCRRWRWRSTTTRCSRRRWPSTSRAPPSCRPRR